MITVLLSVNGEAGEGVLEINQTCAVNGGYFAGDASAVRGNMFDGNNGTGVEVNTDCTLVADNACGGGAC